MAIVLTAKLPDEQIRRIQDTLRAKLLEKAVPAIAKTKEEIVVRNILPKTDLGYTNEEWKTATLASGVNTVITISPLEDKVLGIYGIRYLADTGLCVTVDFYSGVGKTNFRARWQIKEAITEEDREITVTEVEKSIVYEPGEYVTIDYHMVTTGVARVELLGFLAERKERIVGG